MSVHTTSRSPLALAVALLVSVAVLAGCGSRAIPTLADGGWDDVVAAAEEEGQVVFYSGGDAAQADVVAEAFEEKYPEIDVHVERGVKDLFARIEAQIQSGVDGADVFMTADEPWFRSHTGDFLPLEGPGTAGVHENAWVTKGEVAVVHRSPLSIFAWNTEQFPEGFAHWQDFLTPEMQGTVAFRGDLSKSAAGFMDFLTTRFGDDYLRQLGAQGAKLYPSVVPMTQAVASGEVGVTMTSLPSVVNDLK